MKIDNWKISAFNRAMQFVIAIFLLAQIGAGRVGNNLLKPEIHATLLPLLAEGYHAKVVEVYSSASYCQPQQPTPV